MNIQIWTLLIQYLDMAEALSMKTFEMLDFLFQLGSLEFGKDYAVEKLNSTQKTMLGDLKHLGLVFQRNKKSSRFYPTRMATSLTSGNSIDLFFSSTSTVDIVTGLTISKGKSIDSGFILVETNYRIYAYTNSSLQIAILSLFLSLQTRFVNMVAGIVTRDSIRDALSRGISADQV